MTTDYKPLSEAAWYEIDGIMVWEGNEPWHLVDAINSLYSEAKHWRARAEKLEADRPAVYDGYTEALEEANAMTTARQMTHYVGDGCDGGHRTEGEKTWTSH